RIESQSAHAARLANFLESQPSVARVYYPGLDRHRKAATARRQMQGGGSLLGLAMKGGKKAAFAVLDALELVDISNNLGDSKSLACHPATTTHQRLKPEERQHLGITDGVIRLSVGLEDADDLEADLARATS